MQNLPRCLLFKKGELKLMQSMSSVWFQECAEQLLAEQQLPCLLIKQPQQCIALLSVLCSVAIIVAFFLPNQTVPRKMDGHSRAGTGCLSHIVSF